MSRQCFKPTVYESNEDGFKSKISTNTTDEMTSVAFLRNKVCITSKTIKPTHKNEILELKLIFEEYMNKLMEEKWQNYYDNFIFSVNVAEESVSHNKMSHFRYDLFVKSKIPHTMEVHKANLEEIAKCLKGKLVELFNLYELRFY